MSVSAYYDEFSRGALRDWLVPNRRHLAIRDRMQRIRPYIRNQGSALEVGCGVGATTGWLRGYAKHVVGLDISPTAVRAAQALVPDATFMVGDFLSTRLDDQFGLVTLFDVVEHFPAGSLPRLFAKLDAITAGDGVVVVNVPSACNAARVPDEKRQIIDEAVHAGKLVGAAAAVGLEPLFLDRYGITAPNEYVFVAFGRTYNVVGGDTRAYRVEQIARWLLTAPGRPLRRRALRAAIDNQPQPR